MRSGLEPVTFGFPDLPEQEAAALLIQTPPTGKCCGRPLLLVAGSGEGQAGGCQIGTFMAVGSACRVEGGIYC